MADGPDGWRVRIIVCGKERITYVLGVYFYGTTRGIAEPTYSTSHSAGRKPWRYSADLIREIMR